MHEVRIYLISSLITYSYLTYFTSTPHAPETLKRTGLKYLGEGLFIDFVQHAEEL